MAKMLPRIGAIPCQGCKATVPLRQQGNGLVRYDCPYCGCSMQTHDAEGADKLRELAGVVAKPAAPAAAPVELPPKAPAKVPEKTTHAQPQPKTWADALFNP